jgi:DNA polymerase III subunit gamma/tau
MRVHFARYLRPKTFQEVVGQELALRMLKNMLFRQTIFPSYLFAGLRGTGKTTVGRLFAAALNCQQLDAFVKSPRDTVLPCAVCADCRAIIDRDHPDVHEIDAASHTGVDAMRSVLEHVLFMPVQGRKKIYLIDEAHMLSKAAFNACLKVFEEPPEHVVFILATTDPHKVIDTVVSRCFHVYFDPLDMTEVSDYILKIAQQEQIACDHDAAQEIARCTQGSMREALTLLERASLVEVRVTLDLVLSVTGGIGSHDLHKLINAALQGAYEDVYQQCKMRRWSDGRTLWQGFKRHFQEEFRAALREKNKAVIECVSARIRRLCDEEGRWSRSRDPEELAYLVIDLCRIGQSQSEHAQDIPIARTCPASEADVVVAAEPVSVSHADVIDERVVFINQLFSQQEPFVAAALSQARCVQEQGVLQVVVGSEHIFIKDWLEKAVERCAQELATLRPEWAMSCVVTWDAVAPSGAKKRLLGEGQERLTVAKKQSADAGAQSRTSGQEVSSGVPQDVHRLLSFFPGTIKKTGES